MAGIQTLHAQVDNSLETQSQLANIPSCRSNKALERGDNFYTAVILLYFLVSIGITLALIPLLTLISMHDSAINVPTPTDAPVISITDVRMANISHSTERQQLYFTFTFIKVIRNVYSCVVSATLIWLVKCKAKLIKDGIVTLEWQYREEPRSIQSADCRQESNDDQMLSTSTTRHRHNSLFGAALFLGAGSAVMIFLTVITTTQCVVFKYNQGEGVTGSLILSVLNNVVFFVLLVAQLAFFYTYNGAVFSRYSNSIFHFAIALSIASNIWGWLGMTFTAPIWEHIAGEEFHDHAYWCRGNETQIMWYLTKTHRYLSILFPEFSIMAISLLFSYWTTMTKPSTIQDPMSTIAAQSLHRPNIMAIDDEAATLLSPNTSSVKQEYLMAIIKKHPYVMFISSALGLVYVTMTICTFSGSLYDRIKKNNTDVAVIVERVVVVSIFLPATFLIVPCLRRLKHVSPLNVPLSGNDYLLIFASTWALVYDFLQLFSSFVIFSTYLSLALVGIGVSILFSAQVCLQAKFLLMIQRRYVDDTITQNFVRACLIFLTFANAANWLVTGLTHEWAIENNVAPLINVGFDHDIEVEADHPKRNLTIGNAIILIIYPMLSLFRFHSAVICYEMLRTHQPEVRPCLQPPISNDDDFCELSETI